MLSKTGDDLLHRKLIRDLLKHNVKADVYTIEKMSTQHGMECLSPVLVCICVHVEYVFFFHCVEEYCTNVVFLINPVVLNVHTYLYV